MSRSMTKNLSVGSSTIYQGGSLATAKHSTFSGGEGNRNRKIHSVSGSLYVRAIVPIDCRHSPLVRGSHIVVRGAVVALHIVLPVLIDTNLRRCAIQHDGQPRSHFPH